jgi:hypothetical protein
MLRHVEVRDKINTRWRRFFEDRCMTLAPHPIVGPDDTIFVMGSCFSREIKKALARRSIHAGPDYLSIPLSKERYSIDELPDNNHLNFYNSFTVLQEFEHMVGEWTQDENDYWLISRKQFKERRCFQDPYRRLTFGSTPENLLEANNQVSSVIDKAAKQATVFMFTFGIAEVFRLKSNRRVAGQKPAHFGGGGESETDLHFSTFQENFENLENIRRIIKIINPDAMIVVTVSPVALERTFSDRDILVANCEGKSTLRTVLGEFSRAHDDVMYFPAYEMVTSLGEIGFIPGDLRHVKKAVADMIMQTFINAHVNVVSEI